MKSSTKLTKMKTPALSSSRRSFLRSGSALIALPFLESLGFRRFASAAAAPTPPKRFAFLGMGFGVTSETWYPDQKDTGADYTLPEGLAPLAKHRQDLTIIQNLANQFNNEAHWGSTFWLTGANRYAEPGQSFHNTVSVDQVAAEALGNDTRYSSVQLSYKGTDNSGHGPGLSLAWNRQGKPVSALNTPVAAFHRLFSDDTTPLEQRQADLLKQRSILDTVLEDAKTTRRGLTKTDKDKLDEYLQSIREIEERLAKEKEWLEVPKPLPDPAPVEPDKSLQGAEEIKVMYDLMAAAMQVDTTRVFTYRQPLDSFIRSLGATITAHNMSHYQPGNRMDVSQMRDLEQSKLFAHFIDRLKSIKEADGSSLFDHTTVALGSNIHSIHYLTNCPTIITGGGAGIQHGRHLVMPPKTPLCNLWLSLLKGSGIEADSHGDSSGQIRELFVS
ncbi:MAG: DUF1552 domain-containing protein [Verrucomicrobiales bacterium]|nr:DUF1552 domain-containing protein [Verrucomicrobiales bacterium]